MSEGVQRVIDWAGAGDMGEAFEAFRGLSPAEQSEVMMSADRRLDDFQAVVLELAEAKAAEDARRAVARGENCPRCWCGLNPAGSCPLCGWGLPAVDMDLEGVN